MSRRTLTAMLALAGIVLIILDAQTAANGAKDGINLCLQTVIPALFPFFILSALLTNAITGSDSRLLRPLGRLCGIPEGCEILLITGLLGGYPVGAQAVAQAWQNGQLSKQDARRMLGFCSNAGPSFFFGILSLQFANKWIPLMLWLIHIASALTVGIILPGKSHNSTTPPKAPLLGLPGALNKSIGITAGVCSWIVLFRIVIAFLPLGRLSKPLSVTIVGLLELANGCCQLFAIADPATRFLTASGLLALGGICVTMQTATATAGLGLGMYLPGKLLQGIISMLFSLLVCPLIFPKTEINWLIVTFFAAFFPLILAIRKKSVAFPQTMVYNEENHSSEGYHAVS